MRDYDFKGDVGAAWRVRAWQEGDDVVNRNVVAAFIVNMLTGQFVVMASALGDDALPADVRAPGHHGVYVIQCRAFVADPDGPAAAPGVVWAHEMIEGMRDEDASQLAYYLVHNLIHGCASPHELGPLIKPAANGIKRKRSAS